MDGYQYIFCLSHSFHRCSQGNFCLPPAGVLHSQNKVINAPPTASHRAEGWAEGWTLGGSIRAVTYEAKRKRENWLRNLHRQRKNFFYIYDVIVKQNLTAR